MVLIDGLPIFKKLNTFNILLSIEPGLKTYPFAVSKL